MILTPASYIDWCRLYAAGIIVWCDLVSWHLENGE
ncbi:hypothetical protein MicloDRAFT_00064560 [Microvirga lotononidis]|uniref:Uncharacterized protein n=1 Tax=Microvirga lotononidis TaxID=864069 RepID=I4YP37_9HYPH|nr:hypothetical protein MicloDRAFT_00064560 [Microvirga lotononidis]